MKDVYENPLITRYASREMAKIFSDDHKFGTWRRLWVALAEGEKELGLNITDEQIADMKAHLDDINYDVAEAREKEVRHDVMAHVYAFGMQAKSAMPIIHLGATSCYVTDNAEVIIMREALRAVKGKLLQVMKKLAAFALKSRGCPLSDSRIFSPRSSRRWASAPACGCRISRWITRTSRTSSRDSNCAASRVPQVPKPAS